MAHRSAPLNVDVDFCGHFPPPPPPPSTPPGFTMPTPPPSKNIYMPLYPVLRLRGGGKDDIHPGICVKCCLCSCHHTLFKHLTNIDDMQLVECIKYTYPNLKDTDCI